MKLLAIMAIYVSLQGSDQNAGTVTKPLATLSAALRQARELRRLSHPKDTIHIIIKGGLYQLYEPVFIRPEDSGTPDSPTIIEAATNEKVVLSGGIQVKDWKQAKSGLFKAAKGNIRVADIKGDFRQIWVNGQKASRAKSPMQRILSWDHKTETCRIPAPQVPYKPGMEMLIHQWWAIAILRVKDMHIQGDSAQLSFYQPESRIESEHPWPAPWISKESGNSGFFLANTPELLDEPGEWYADGQHLYYWPKPKEDITTVVIPTLETLIKITGTIDHPVSYLSFKGISFEHTTWLRPSQQGHVPLQSGMYLLDAYKLQTPGTPDKPGLENQAWVGRPPAAIEATYTSHTAFEGCRFEHLASTGLDYKRGNHDDIISGNLFKDIGGTGIQLGIFSDEATEAHLPYLPKDMREVCSGITISNNLVTDVTNEDWGTLGISAGYVKDVTITHNEVCEVSYTGISIGWGWTKTINAMSNNRITANKVHHYARYMYDVAGIYTLSAQPGSLICNNYIDSIYKAPYAHIPTHWFYLYTDEGTSYYTVKDNWCPSEKFLQNANGPNNVWENNGPQVADSIKQAAGLEGPYQYLLKEKNL
jgi:hypothetical protein